jgi:hypothetical protein
MDAVSDPSEKTKRRRATLDLVGQAVVLGRGTEAMRYSPADLSDKVRAYLTVLGLKTHLLADADPDAAYAALVQGEIPETRPSAEIRTSRWREAIVAEIAYMAAQREAPDRGSAGLKAADLERLVAQKTPAAQAFVDDLDQDHLEKFADLKNFQERYSKMWGRIPNEAQIDALLEAAFNATDKPAEADA